MAGQLDEILKHRYIYVPRGTESDTLGPGKQLGMALAREHRAHLTVVAPRKDAATFHPEIAKFDIVTERSGHPQDGGVVLAWCPTYKVMEKVQHLDKSVILLVEWITGEFAAWARIHRAYNIVTSEVMGAGLSPEVLEAMEAIVSEGYNGWTKRTDVHLTLRYLDDIAKAGGYDREMVLAYARQNKSEGSIERLNGVLDTFEASRASAVGSVVPTWRSRVW